MNRSIRGALTLSVSLCAGCIGSLYPVYTDADVLLDPRLEGRWCDSSLTESAVITRTGPTSYHIGYTDDQGETGQFVANLIRLGGRLVLDVQPEKPVLDASGSYRDLLQPLHTFVFLDTIGPRVRATVLGVDSLDRYLRANPGVVPHARVENRLMLTARPLELQGFLSEYIRRPGALSEPVTWVRRSP